MKRKYPPIYMKLTEVMDGPANLRTGVLWMTASKDDSLKVLSEIYNTTGRQSSEAAAEFRAEPCKKAGFDFARGDVIVR